MSINGVRFESLYKSISAIARKTYDSTPIEEAWFYQDIHNDMTRCGHNVDQRTVRGCLNSLIAAGLIVETTTNHFKRVPVRNKTTKTEVPKEPAMQQATTQAPTTKAEPKESPKLSTLERLSAVTKQMRVIADEIDSIALDFDAQLVEKDAQLAQFNQLKTLLAGIK